MKRILPLLFAFSLYALNGWSQQPPDACPPGVDLTSTCETSCVFCNINGFIGYNDITALGMAPDGFCAPQLHNTQWVGFVAGSNGLTMQIDVYNCNQGNGLQIGVYSTLDCESFTLVSECYPAIPPNTFATFNVATQAGGIYFIVVDGNVGDICNFSVNILSGSGSAPPVTGNAMIQAQGPFCPGGTFPFTSTTVNGASVYDWTVNGQPAGYTQTTNITIPATGSSFQVCVTPSNPCFTGNQICQNFPITQLPLNNLGTVKICQGQSYTVGNMTFSQTGLYNFMVPQANGCLRPTRLNLIVQPPQFTNLGTVTICSDELPYLVGGQPAFPGPNTFNLFTTAGCDSTVTVNLIVNDVQATLVDEVICQGSSITVSDNFGHSYTFNQTGQYQVTLTTPQGCDNFVYVNLLVVPPPPLTVLYRTICQGDYFLLGNQALTQPGIYNANLDSYAGCDSLVTLYLSVSNPVTNLSQTICAGQSVTIGNSTYSTSGNFTKVLQNASYLGCDSTVNLNLTVLPPNITNLTPSICQGESYTVGTTSYTNPGTYQQHFIAQNGCDSTVNLNLTVLPVPQTSLSETLCFGETYSVGAETYDVSGLYRDTLTALNGCDSIITLNLTILPEVVTNLTESICEDETYSVGTSTYNTTGTYTNILTAVTGCDSTVNLNLTVLPIPQTSLSATICQGASYSVGNSDYTASGAYTDILTAANGCDSLVFLALNVIPPTEYPVSAAICTGQTYTVGTSGYTASGLYRDTLSNSIGCDSIVVLTLTVADILEETLDVSICESESFTVGSSTYNQTGSYDEFFVTATGCDSVLHLNLTVFDEPETNLAISICDGESFGVGTSTYTTTGNYVNILTAATGCDSVVNLALTVLDVPETSLTESICDGESYQVGNSTYTASGAYTDVLTAANGCDSIVTLALTVLNVPQTALVESICDGESYQVGSSTYSTPGIYQDVLVAANGCDSIIDLNLTVLDVPETTLTELICNGETYSLGTSDYTTSGTYLATFTAANGCDSIVTLNLTVAPTPTTFIDAAICTGGSYTVGTSVYNTAGIYTNVLTTALGCDSTVVLDLEVTSFYETNLNIEICEGETYQVGNSVYSTTGVYQDMFISQDLCDSIVNLNLTVFPVPVTDLAPSICDGESYSVGTSTYTTTGTYQNVLTTVNGCDSIVNLALTVLNVPVTNLTPAICDGESFQVGTSTYTTAGVYQNVLVAANGCDSIVNLNLTILNNPQTTLTPAICQGESYSVGSSTYTASGAYTDVLTAANGCDSTVFLNLTVIPTATTALTQAICQGESFQVGSSTYNTSGVYQDVLTAATGCDSIVTLNLTVNPVYSVTLTEAICEGDSYQVGNNSFSANGTFVTTLNSINGCDSVVTLNLTVYPCELAFTLSGTDALCNGSADGSFTFALTRGTPPYNYSWQSLSGGPSGTGVIAGNNINTLIGNLPAGNYRITVTDSYNIQDIINFSVQQPTPVTASLSASNFNGFGISCAESTDGSFTANAGGGTPPYNYAWNNNQSGITISNLGAGNYIVTITDQHGCQTQAQGVLNAPESLKVTVETSDPPCFGDETGFANISEVTGGVGPYTYSIDDSPFSTVSVLPNLGVGIYAIQVQDDNGCLWEGDITINQPQELIVDLGDDQRIKLGESIQLQALTSYPVDSYIWKQDSTLSCFDCFNPVATPATANTYTVTVMDENGCTAMDRINIVVEKPRLVYIPNAFSPDEDGVNDQFMIFGGNDVRSVKSFLVFNRWGESMFELYNFQPNNPAFGWDGTHRGRPLNAGVYVYFAEIEFIDGEVLLYKGDVILMK